MSEVQEASDVDFASFVTQNSNITPPREEPTTSAEAPATEDQSEAVTEPTQTNVTDVAEEKQKEEQKSSAANEAQAAAEKKSATERAREFRRRTEAEKQKLAARKAEQERQLELQELQQLRGFTQKLRTDPLSAFEEAGLSYDQITDEYIKRLDNNPGDPHLTVLQKRLDQLEAQLRVSESRAHESQKKALLSEFNADVSSQIQKDGHAFLEMAGEEGLREISRLQVEFFNRYGELMTTAEACEVAEEAFEQRYRKLEAAARKKSGVKQQPKPTGKTSVESRTLSNDMIRSAKQELQEEDSVEAQLRWLQQQGAR